MNLRRARSPRPGRKTRLWPTNGSWRVSAIGLALLALGCWPIHAQRIPSTWVEAPTVERKSTLRRERTVLDYDLRDVGLRIDLPMPTADEAAVLDDQLGGPVTIGFLVPCHWRIEGTCLTSPRG